MPSITHYSIENLTNTSSTGNVMVSFMRGISSQTAYLPGLIIVLIIYFIVFIALKTRGYSIVNSFTAANFVGFTISLLMYPLQVLSGKVLVVFICLIPISLFIMWVTGGEF